MFDLEKAIAEWRRQFTAEEVGGVGSLDELESHLRDDFVRFLALGMPEAAAFEKAVGELGLPGELASEFARARPMWGGGYNIAVKALAVWFIVNGGGNLLQGLRLVFAGGNVLHQWVILYIFLLGSVLLALGIGLQRRIRLWRFVAIAWCAWFCAAILASVLIPALRSHSMFIYAPPAQYALVGYGVLGMVVPYNVFYAMGFVHLVMWIFGGCLLLAPRSRRYFFAARG